ncbi:MAG: hypothetical protein EOL97_12085 [Spirochaetia bacterium]|nr:hypothetical protein [Spirochaetia bacterium]
MNLNTTLVIKSESNIYQIFPWFGSKEINALSLILNSRGFKTSIDNEIYLSIEKTKIDCETILNEFRKIISEEIDPLELKISKDLVYNIFKNDKYLPYELAKKQYLDFFCDFDSMKRELIKLLKKDNSELYFCIY